jgi:hypothetical protein
LKVLAGYCGNLVKLTNRIDDYKKGLGAKRYKVRMMMYARALFILKGSSLDIKRILESYNPELI